MRALKVCISFVWVLEKYEPRFMKVIQNCISFVWALQQCASRFYEGLKNAHRLFMSLSKFRITIYEIHKTRISGVGPLEQCASPFYAAPEKVRLLIYESFKSLHRNLCRSKKNMSLALALWWHYCCRTCFLFHIAVAIFPPHGVMDLAVVANHIRDLASCHIIK